MEQAFKNSLTSLPEDNQKNSIHLSPRLAKLTPPEITSIQLVVKKIIYSDRLKQNVNFLTIGGSRLNLRKRSSPLAVRLIQGPERCSPPVKLV